MENEGLVKRTTQGETMLHESVVSRSSFIKKTYLHLAGAIGAFTALEYLLFQTGLAYDITVALTSISWLIVIGLFMLVSWVAEKWALSDASKQKQYLGLGLFIIAEAIIFCPLLYIAAGATGSQNLIASAAIMTLMLFGGLTFFALTSASDFSFLGGAIRIGFFVIIGLIISSVLFELDLGVWFSAGMIIFSGAVILYQTGSLREQYHETQHVAAALGLFASVALMFWYILQLLMSLGGDD